MKRVIFDNVSFDSWLTKKSDEILNKVDRETITTKDELTLILKAQADHLHHIDIRFRNESKCTHREFKYIHREFKLVSSKTDQRFNKILNYQKWHLGIMIALFAGLYLKLFLG